MMATKHRTNNGYTRFFMQASVLCIFLLVGLLPLRANALEILVGTGEIGTFSNFAGRLICRMVSKSTEDITCKTVPAPDDVHNLTNLRGGSLDIALIDSRMLNDAINKTGYFEFLDISYDNLRAFIPLYEVPFTLVVRRDAKISSLEELKGKRINFGAPRSPQHLTTDTIITAKNWAKTDFSLAAELSASQSQDTMAFCHGTTQAMVHIGVHPDATLQQLFKLCEADFVNMDDNDIQKLVNDRPEFLKITIAANTYPINPKSITTFGTSVALVASDNLDEETAYQIVSAIDRHQKYLKSAHPALAQFTIDAAGKNDVGLSPHPGVIKYLSEN